MVIARSKLSKTRSSGPALAQSRDLKEIRTGAADSSWVRDVIRHSDSDVSSLLFLSANRRDIVATATELGYGESNIFSSGREDELFSDFLPPDSSLDPVSLDLSRNSVLKSVVNAKGALPQR